MESATYSATVVDKVVMVCILEAHVKRQAANQITQPALDLDVMKSYGASCGLQFPAKSESTQHSKIDRVSGFRINPLSLVPLR